MTLLAWLVGWTRRIGHSPLVVPVVTVAAIASGVATYAVLANSDPVGASHPHTMILALMVLDLVVVLLLASLVARRIVQVWAERRSGSAGSRLHVRLVVMFSAVAVTPAILVAVFSALLIQYGLEQWFNARVSTALQESLAVANAYLQEHQRVIGGDAMAMASDLDRGGSILYSEPDRLQQLVEAEARARALSEAVVFDASGRILARAGLAYSMDLSINQVPRWAFDRARAGEVAVVTNPGDERVRALVLLGGGIEDTFLFVGRFVDPRVLAHVQQTSMAVAEYERLQGARSGLEITFSVIYAVVAMLLLLAAVWIGFVLANHLATPISRLIDAAGRVREGDLSARVAEPAANDELATLSRAFNRMTSQLDTQRRELVAANLELDERRRFTEAVLGGVSAGVIGLDRDGRVTLPNRSAALLLGLEEEGMKGGALGDVVPEMQPLLVQAMRRTERSVEDQITLRRGGRARVLLARIAAEVKEGETVGYVVTFDDITELLAAQRQAAWADVARRIAHEIKNPLTPIQLSAERLRRKYLKEISSDKETFTACTDTIVRQVGDIGRMVDEFSAFARMPAPVMKEEDIADVVRQAVFLARTGYPEVRFDVDLPAEPLRLHCDARQVGQALTNLLKNAVEAIGGREGKNLPQGRVLVRAWGDDEQVVIAAEDNGKGLPEEQRERLAEPYVTTRAKGTGLGLAIVKKITEDHGGILVLEDLDGQGARVSLIFRRRDDGDRAAVEGGEAKHGA